MPLDLECLEKQVNVAEKLNYYWDCFLGRDEDVAFGAVKEWFLNFWPMIVAVKRVDRAAIVKKKKNYEQ